VQTARTRHRGPVPARHVALTGPSCHQPRGIIGFPFVAPEGPVFRAHPATPPAFSSTRESTPSSVQSAWFRGGIVIPKVGLETNSPP
jgi:hypothetical protein